MNKLPAPNRSKRNSGVTSIEYALLAALIALVVLSSLVNVGGANGAFWSDWTQKVIAAIAS